MANGIIIIDKAMANGIIIIDKPQDWISMDICAPAYASHTPGTPF